MITCRELIEFLMEYVDGSLPVDQRAYFDEHLQVCPECVAYLRTYVATVKAEKACCGDSTMPPEKMPENLVRAILAARKSGERGTTTH